MLIVSGGELVKVMLVLFETITNGFMQWSLALMVLGVATSLTAQHMYALNP
jgi:hypothetical protein